MPVILPPLPSTNYDSATTILNAARVRLNDKIQTLVGVRGTILGETDPLTNQAFNNGYRRFQDGLVDAGSERFSGQVIISQVPIVGSYDPASQCSMSWFGMFDGVNNFSTPALPNNLILPLWMSERPSGSNSPFPSPNTPNMFCATDGLPMYPKGQRNACWEWREDAIWFPGATITVDFLIRYRSYLADLVDVGTTRWFQQSVPIMRCSDPLSWWVCAEFAAARASDGSIGAQMLSVAAQCKAEAVEATKRWVNQEIQKNQRLDVRRIPYGSSSRGGGYGGWGYRG